VAGAIYSGFAMVLNIVIPLRRLYKLESYITLRHLNNMANVMLATGLMVAYGYLMEAFMSWFSGDIYEESMMVKRAFGPTVGPSGRSCSPTCSSPSCSGSGACASRRYCCSSLRSR